MQTGITKTTITSAPTSRQVNTVVERDNKAKKELFIVIPDTSVVLISTYLSPFELIKFSQLTRRCYQLCTQNSLWQYFVKPEVLTNLFLYQNESGQAKKLFQIPAFRLDQYVPLDTSGLQYLRSLSITNKKIIEHIKSSRVTIEQASETEL